MGRSTEFPLPPHPPLHPLLLFSPPLTPPPFLFCLIKVDWSTLSTGKRYDAEFLSFRPLFLESQRLQHPQCTTTPETDKKYMDSIKEGFCERIRPISSGRRRGRGVP